MRDQASTARDIAMKGAGYYSKATTGTPIKRAGSEGGNALKLTPSMYHRGAPEVNCLTGASR